MRIIVLKENKDNVVLKFPKVTPPVVVSKRYFRKLQKSEDCEIIKENKSLPMTG